MQSIVIRVSEMEKVVIEIIMVVLVIIIVVRFILMVRIFVMGVSEKNDIIS